MNYKISELIMDHEIPLYSDVTLKGERKVQQVKQGNKTRYLTIVDDKNIEN